MDERLCESSTLAKMRLTPSGHIPKNHVGYYTALGEIKLNFV
jgi:hypothetical protein